MLRKYEALEHIDEEWKYYLKPVTIEVPKEALATTTKMTPIYIAASRDNVTNPTSFSTTWIMSFLE